MPLRFSSSLKKASGLAAALQWTALALLFLLLAAGVMLFYSLSIGWFKKEFNQAVVELTQKEAFRTSRTIVEMLSQSLSSGGIPPSDEERITESLAQFIRQNPNVVGAIISNSRGRIVRIRILPRAATGPTLQNINEHGDSLVGSDEETLLNLLATEQPNLLPVRRYITAENRPVGWLTLLVDWTITTDAMNLAINRMTGRLTMVLGAVTMALALATLLIRRQQRIARRLYEQRSEVERLAYVGTLAAGLAHEIRNPLNALAMQLELLEEDVSDGAPELVTPRLQHIRKGLTGVERTVHDFLTYATPGKQQPRMIDLASEINPFCQDAIQSSPGRPVHMECLVAPGLMAWCDPHALRQVLGNLISNAVRAQQKGAGEPRIRIEANRNGHWIDILVDDAGGGVAREQQHRVFDCFYTTQSEGTGLGLPIARRLAEMNGGQLQLEPNPSPLGGARFRLTLSARPLTPAFD